MIRNLKALGLALVAMLAMSALAAASASAQVPGHLVETDEDYPVHIHGEDTVPGVGELTPALTSKSTGGIVECDIATYTGNITGPTKRITITPTYEECYTVAGEEKPPVTVTMNGCDYEFYGATARDEIHDNWDVTVDLVCPETKKVEIHHYENHTKHTEGKSNCTVTLEDEDNKELHGLTITNETNPDALEIHGETETTGLTHGPCSFGFTLEIKSTLDVNATVEGTEGKEIIIDTTEEA